MKTELFSILDEAAGRYLDPWPAPTMDFALRGFKEAVMTEGHQFAKFPEDYSMYHVGTFDPESGIIEAMEPRKVANAVSFTGDQLSFISDFRNELDTEDD